MRVFFRGIRKKDWLIPAENGYPEMVSEEAFQPDLRTSRIDCHETSITWNREPASLQFARKARAEFGVISVSQEGLTSALGQFGGALSHQESPTETNPFHGDLLFKSNLDKHRRRVLCQLLSLNAIRESE